MSSIYRTNISTIYRFGNGKATIGYTANGEASDWFLGEWDIIAMSPEIGGDALSNNGFFPPEKNILKIVTPHYPFFLRLIQRATPELMYIYIYIYYIYIYIYYIYSVTITDQFRVCTTSLNLRSMTKDCKQQGTTEFVVVSLNIQNNGLSEIKFHPFLSIKVDPKDLKFSHYFSNSDEFDISMFSFPIEKEVILLSQEIGGRESAEVILYFRIVKESGMYLWDTVGKELEIRYSEYPKLVPVSSVLHIPGDVNEEDWNKGIGDLSPRYNESLFNEYNKQLTIDLNSLEQREYLPFNSTEMAKTDPSHVPMRKFGRVVFLIVGIILIILVSICLLIMCRAFQPSQGEPDVGGVVGIELDEGGLGGSKYERGEIQDAGDSWEETQGHLPHAEQIGSEGDRQGGYDNLQESVDNEEVG